MDNPAPRIHWPDPIMELIGFIASFLAVGAVAFRLWVVARILRAPGSSPDEKQVLENAARRAAVFGFLGALVSAALFATRLPEMAERRHMAVAQLLTSVPQTQLQAALVLCTFIGLALALGRVRFGWALAAVGVLAAPLSGALFGQWTRLGLPIHKFGGGLWIGTLFMLVFAGILTVLGSALPSERRGALVARLVNAFSPLALVSAGVLATFGVIVSLQQLQPFSALWTTPYGITLIIKLLMVGVCCARHHGDPREPAEPEAPRGRRARQRYHDAG